MIIDVLYHKLLNLSKDLDRKPKLTIDSKKPQLKKGYYLKLKTQQVIQAHQTFLKKITITVKFMDFQTIWLNRQVMTANIDKDK